mgnify:CR=1 FL=1
MRENGYEAWLCAVAECAVDCQLCSHNTPRVEGFSTERKQAQANLLRTGACGQFNVSAESGINVDEVLADLNYGCV